MQDRPTSRELLALVAELLAGRVAPALDGAGEVALAREVASAVEVLGLLEREAQLGTGHLLKEREALCRLLDLDTEDLLPGSLADQVADLNQQLAADIDDHRLSAAAERRVRDVVLAMVANKLAVVHPGWADWDSGVEVP